MADLPETEILRRQLQDRLLGQTVLAADLAGADGGVLVGLKLDNVTRHGRRLLLHFDGWRVLLPMIRTARLTVGVTRARSPVRLSVTFEGGLTLSYRDGSRNSRLALFRDGDETAGGKGVEPLSSAFSLGTFKRILAKRTRSVKFALSEDDVVAGLGTLYPDEILHLAGIRPDRAVADLTDDDKRDLYFAIFQVLHKAIRFGGLSGNGYTLDGKAGGFERFVGVVRREGERCSSCQGRVRRVELDRRQAWFCPRCQH